MIRKQDNYLCTCGGDYIMKYMTEKHAIDKK